MAELSQLEKDNSVFNPYDVDKEEFNVDLSMESYCKSYNLSQIISRRNKLDSEIRDIKANIQSIVYDNYNKVIDTSKVIGKITNNFDGMSNDMELLQEKMLRLENTSHDILERFQTKREKMAELLKNKKNLSKVIDLIELIPNLKKLVEEDENVKAAEFYLDTEEQLKLYGHLPSCEGIVRESKELVTVIQKKLKEKTDCNVYSIEEVSKIMELQLRLGIEGEGILKDFFAQTKCHFRSILNTINCVYDEDIPHVPKQEAILAESRGSWLCESGLRYIDILCKASTTVRNVFLKRDSLTHTFKVLPVLGDFMAISVEELFQKLKIKFRDLFDEISDEFIANILDRLYRRWYDCCLLIPSAEITQLSAQVFLEFCHERCKFYYQRMESDFQACVAQLHAKATDVKTLDKTSTWFSVTIENIFTSTLTSLRVFVSLEHKCSRNIYFRKIFSKVFVREGVFVTFIRHLLQQASILRSEVVSSKKDRINLRSYLLLSLFVKKLSHTVVKKLFKSIDESFHSSSSDLVVAPVDDLSSECDSVANEMLREFVHAWARTMSMMFDKSIDNKNWFDMKEPRRVSSVARRVAEEFEAVAQDTEFTLPLEESSVKSLGLTHCQSSISRASSASIDSDDSRVIHRISKLFFQSPRYFEKIKFCRDSVLSSVLELALKCLLEYVRLKTFNCYGLQQMQVDLHYLEKKALRHLRDEKHFASLFDDILSSCIHRTVKPELLNPQVVSVLCNTY